jgi:phosphopantothenoylcysteine decarboxylase/phosphopantothenate--cysteine ligase
MLEPEALFDAITALRAPKRLANKQIVLTAGPTFEPIDPVRGITNLSSGKMGYALAQACVEAGATVTLVSGPTHLAPPVGAQLVQVQSAVEMLAATEQAIADADIFIAVAAVADYTPARPATVKMKKNDQPLSLELKPTIDILARIAGRPDAPLCVGFAAESEKLLEYAEEKRRKKKLPLIVANLAQNAIGQADNEVVLIDDAGHHPLPRGAKLAVARGIVAHIAALLESRSAAAGACRENCS